MRQAFPHLRQAAGRITRRWRRTAVILMYHRVADVASDPWNLSVSPAHFAEHLRLIRQLGRPLRLTQLVAALEQGRLPDRSVVVTFDDGYADNLVNAKPLLLGHDVPGTVFVATGLLGQPRGCWWDELERLILHPGVLPPTLSLSIDGRTQSWELADAADYGRDAFERDRRWNAWAAPTGIRQQLFVDLWAQLRQLPSCRRNAILRQLRAVAAPSLVDAPLHPILTEEELRRLAEPGHVELGAHTVGHPLLATLPVPEQDREIRASKQCLEQLLDQRVTAFAYPFGGRTDYTSASVALVRAAGFACACATFPGVVSRSVDPFELPRFHVPNWDGDVFAYHLRNWLGG